MPEKAQSPPIKSRTGLVIVLIVVGVVGAFGLCCGGVALVGVLRYREAVGQAQLEEARKKVMAISQSVLRYQVRNGDYPASLEVLTQPDPDGSPAYLERGALVDPWGRPLKYDRAGPRNKGDRPDVWSDGPNPSDPKGLIGNW